MNARTALRDHVLGILATARLRLRKPAATIRDRAFDRYFADLRGTLMGPPTRFRLRARERLAIRPDGGAAWRLGLEAQAAVPFTPGDLLYVRWENHPDLVAEVRALLPALAGTRRVWTDSYVWSPGRLVRADAATVLTRILDLHAEPVPGESLPAFLRRNPTHATWEHLLATQPRIRPRLYTIARGPTVGADRTFELLVSAGRDARGSGRCAGYLERLAPGAEIQGHVLAHPHRLPPAHGHGGPGIVVVTGTAIAGVLAFLNARQVPAGTWLVWGIRNPDDFAGVQRELMDHAASGALGRVDVVSSVRDGRRAPEFLRAHADEVRVRLETGAWVYLSGHEAMAADVEAFLAEIGGAPQLSAWKQSLRVVESASG